MTFARIQIVLDDIPDLPLGACIRIEHADIFFPKAGGGWTQEAKLAKSICKTCPERRRCLAWALEHEVDGIWGATTLVERRLITNGRSA